MLPTHTDHNEARLQVTHAVIKLECSYQKPSVSLIDKRIDRWDVCYEKTPFEVMLSLTNVKCG